MDDEPNFKKKMVRVVKWCFFVDSFYWINPLEMNVMSLLKYSAG